MTPGARLPRAARLHDEKQFAALRDRPSRRGRWFAVKQTSNEIGYARVAVRIAKRVLRHAVARNRIRRCVREVFRHERAILGTADYLVSLQRPYREPTLAAACEELKRLLRTDP